jgi:hypothetical protein
MSEPYCSPELSMALSSDSYTHCQIVVSLETGVAGSHSRNLTRKAGDYEKNEA